MANRKVGKQRKPGPKGERLSLSGTWQAAMNKALAKKKPAVGWPKPKKDD